MLKASALEIPEVERCDVFLFESKEVESFSSAKVAETLCEEVKLPVTEELVKCEDRARSICGLLVCCYLCPECVQGCVYVWVCVSVR